MTEKSLAQKLMDFGYGRSQAYNIARTPPEQRTDVQQTIIAVIERLEEIGTDLTGFLGRG